MMRNSRAHKLLLDSVQYKTNHKNLPISPPVNIDHKNRYNIEWTLHNAAMESCRKIQIMENVILLLEIDSFEELLGKFAI